MSAAPSSQDDAQRIPTRASLRALLFKVAVTDTELRSLCIDHLPETLRHFGGGMSYDAMVNALLEHVPPTKLLSSLEECSHMAESVAAYRGMLVFDLPVAAANIAPSSGPGRRSLPPPRSAYDPAWYISRSEEESQALEALEYPGAAIALIAPEAFGKTWLLQHLLAAVQGRGRVVNLDLRAFGDAELMKNYSRFLRELARQILVDACGTRPEIAAAAIEEAWCYSDNPIDNINTLMRRKILCEFSDGKWLILALDGVDALGRHPYLEDFFTLLRSWMDSAGRPPWSALRLLLSLSTAPRLLISSIHQSPFNIATQLHLSDFNEEQIARLAALHELSWDRSERQDLQSLIGGHPYLLRLAMYEARRHGRSIADLTAPQSRIFMDFLAQKDRWLRTVPLVRDAFMRSLTDARASIDFDCFDRLRHAGLLLQDESLREIQPRYALLRRLLKSGG